MIELIERRTPAELSRCAADPVAFITDYCVTYDPRLLASGQSPYVPFRLYPKQIEYVRWLQEREATHTGGIVEKARDAGCTYVSCAYALHGFLFRPGFACGFGSRKLDLVDKIGDMDSILEKVRDMLRRLPEWMLPDGWKLGVHDAYCKLINPANGASITGEGGDEIGRGGRKALYFVDEAAFLERPKRVEAALSATTNVQIDISTHNGPGTLFFLKRFSGKHPVFEFDWRDDPRKSEEWYATQVATKDPVIVAQEIDRNPFASIEGICIPAEWVRSAVELELPEEATTGQTVAGLDVADEGPNLNVQIFRTGAKIGQILHWRQGGTTRTAHRAATEADERAAVYVFYDVVGVGTGVKGALEASDAEYSCRFVAVNGGDSPTETVWPKYDNRSSKQLFVNLRAELWWNLRTRFEKAHEYVTQGIAHPPDEMISIPDHPDLIAQLCLPLWFRTETGKIKLESKEAMRRRGVASPDYGDALAYCYAPAPAEWTVW